MVHRRENLRELVRNLCGNSFLCFAVFSANGLVLQSLSKHVWPWGWHAVGPTGQVVSMDDPRAHRIPNVWVCYASGFLAGAVHAPLSLALQYAGGGKKNGKKEGAGRHRLRRRFALAMARDCIGYGVFFSVYEA